MKTKRTFLSILTLCIALLFTACSGKGTAGTESSNTKTESGSESADDSNSKLNDLYQQENQIFADHKDVWDKAFGMMSKKCCRSKMETMRIIWLTLLNQTKTLLQMTS